MATPELRQVARADLCRTAPFTLRADAAAGDDADGLTIDGYATVYGRDLRTGEEPSQEAGWAMIDSWEGTFWERFRFGAFRKSIREKLPRMQFDHGRHPLLGSLPLGRWSSVTEEAENGLHTVGRLSDNWLVQPFREAIRDEAVDGMSIRFEVVSEEWRDVDGKIVRDEELLDLLWRPGERGPLRRTVREAKLPEAGPVTWPAYQATSVGVRSVTIDLGRLHDPAQRALLARAVFLADAAQQEQDPSPQATDLEGPAGEHEGRTEDGTPQSTDVATSAGEHESCKSPTERPMDDVDRRRMRAAAKPAADAFAEINAVMARLGTTTTPKGL